MAKIPALTNALRFGRHGATLRSRGMLFCMALLDRMGERRVRARDWVHRLLLAFNGSGRHLEFSVRVSGRRFRFAARAHDRADYRTILECLDGAMYPPPARTIRHVFDGGGNIGLFSLTAMARTRAEDIVIVEPDPANFDLLRRNLAPFPKAVAWRGALASASGTARFIRDASNTARFATLVPDESAGISYEVVTRRVSELLPPDWNPAETWLKLDIEGAEHEVVPDLLTGGLRPGAISMEIHDYRNGGEALVEHLRAAGYDVTVTGAGDSGIVCRQISASLAMA